MQPEAPKLLEDIRAPAAYILDKTGGKTLDQYLSDDLLRLARCTYRCRRRVLSNASLRRRERDRSSSRVSWQTTS